MKKDYIIEKIIDSGLISPNTAVVIGVSGGPDSLCLLHALSSISEMYGLILIPVHVNHGLRPEAAEESDRVAEMCDRMGLDCQIYEASCRELAADLGISLEEAGREIRYQIFDDVANDAVDMGIPKDKICIAVAHNADDQAETVLFRLIRGTGPHGLSGIPPVRLSEQEFKIVRPLLNVARRDIEAYIKENRLRPNIDKSNSDNSYTRNRIRNELIPYLEKNFNPKIRDNLRRFAMLACMDDMLLEDIAFSEYADSIKTDDESGRTVLDLKGLKENPPSVNSRVVTLIMSLLGLEAAVTYENVTAVMNLIYSDHPSAGVDLPLGIRAYREYDRLVFSSGEEDILPDESLQIRPRVVPAAEFEPDENAPYAAFDFDSFSVEYPGRIGDITLRARRGGDYLPMKNGSKKIQDLLVDSKVKKTARDSILLAAIDSEVLWVLPSPYFAGEKEKTKGRFSQKFHINDATERVLIIELEDSI